MDRPNEFEEIGHTGGKVTFTITTDKEGRRSYQLGFTHARPVASVMTGVYAIAPGVPVATMSLGGLGQPGSAPPLPGCLPVLIASDSQGKFGHDCPTCGRYWRSGPWPNLCPYCAIRAEGYQFLSKAQLRYVRHYFAVLSQALDAEHDGEAMIDMDAVADAAGKEGEKPAFYVSEQGQQRKFTCGACEEFNDILGRYGYCSSCGTRNDLADFEGETVSKIRERLNSGAAPEDCVRDAVASFDSYLAQYAKQLAELVPMTERRKRRLTAQAFHDLQEIRTTLSGWFDMNVCDGMDDREVEFVAQMFLRRHVYEHNGGEVDQKYLDRSGDTSVRLKQRIHETREDAHRLLGSLVKMARNVHGGFHELFPPFVDPIKAFAEKKARMAEYAKRDR